MKKICLQAGHGYASGGAPLEKAWTEDTVKKMQSILGKRYEVYITGKNANTDPKVTGTDWDIFLAIHYDADIYNDTGGFVDYPEPSTDYSTEKSQKYAKAISDYYFKNTGIKNMPKRSNANTRYYYMWKSLSAKTPCVLIECGVGYRKPEDYNRLRKGDIPQILSDAIITALGDKVEVDCCVQVKLLEQKIKEAQDALNKSINDFSVYKTSSAKELESIKVKLNESNNSNADLKKQLKMKTDKMEKAKKAIDSIRDSFN